MSVSVRRGLLVLIAAIIPVGADACCLGTPFDTCGVCRPRPWIGFTFALPIPGPCLGGCGPCGPCPPPAPCGCGPSIAPSIGPTLPAPDSSACIAPPVCATPLQPQQVATYRDVPTVQYRREAFVAHVPVTTYEQITVPRTVYQPQTRYRDVAYMVNQRVAETRTQYVPQPRVGYLPRTPVASPPCGPPAAHGLNPQFAAPGAASIGPPPYLRSYPYATPQTENVPSPIALPQSTPSPSPSAATLQPPQTSAGATWQTIPQRPQRQAEGQNAVQQMSGQMPAYSPPPRAPQRSMFQPAPSAASVWQSRWMR